MSYASYTPPAYSSNVFVPGWIYVWCWWKVPCYEQFDVDYNGVTCLVWCVPVAYAIIYWYYDRKWTFPDLFPWKASTLNNDISKIVIEYLWKVNLWTYCKNWWWATSATNVESWINYAKERWYLNSYSELKQSSLSVMFNILKYEISNWRPIIANTDWHSMVSFWYYESLNSGIKIIRLNLWYWPSYQVSNGYYWSNIDYNINSIYYEWQNKWSIKSVVRVVISN